MAQCPTSPCDKWTGAGVSDTASSGMELSLELVWKFFPSGNRHLWVSAWFEGDKLFT